MPKPNSRSRPRLGDVGGGDLPDVGTADTVVVVIGVVSALGPG
jgi:hypothetical protein